MNNIPEESAYRKAPWRKQTQRILNVLVGAFIIAGIIMVYLSISEQMTAAKLNIQVLQEERNAFSSKIADLTTDEGRLTSYKTMEERAKKAGFTAIDFDDETQYEYVIVDGYAGTGINTTEYAADQVPLTVSLIRPEYTQSLQDWLARQITTGIKSYESDH